MTRHLKSDIINKNFSFLETHALIGKSNDVSKRQEQRVGGSGSPAGGTHEAAAREDGNGT
ncbi:hypothetical protein J41TS4_03080 [Paenibacillus apis]|uniref:Uncharacterized protein n=1 Tax=Paenibacillus apis TaxID=1792174 RepID=A0A919Y1W3_9BACL|nr:hypothetical protein J41TS4_03080 [Paenibacillus apis]